MEAGADVNLKDSYGWSPIEHACRRRCLPSVQLLLEAGCALDDLNLGYYLGFYPCFPEKPVGTELALIAGLVDRRRRLQELAEMALSKHVLEKLRLRHDSLLDGEAANVYTALVDNGVDVEPSLKVTRDMGSVYHRAALNCGVADELYHAGDRDVDRVDPKGRTPLMGNFHPWYSPTGFSQMVKYASWLISKGADPHRILPNSTASALHQFCHNVGVQIVARGVKNITLISQIGIRPKPGFSDHCSALDDKSQDFLLEILTRDDADECLCSCSMGGCSTLTTMLRCIFRELNLEWGDEWIANPMSLEAWFIQRFLELMHPQLQNNQGAARTIIRFRTFNEMELIHTCCQAPDDELLTALDPEEVEEIREEERTMLDELEELMTEFESKYDELGLPLTEFLEVYWTPRMREVLEKEEPVEEDHIKRVRGLGVVLDE